MAMLDLRKQRVWGQQQLRWEPLHAVLPRMDMTAGRVLQSGPYTRATVFQFDGSLVFPATRSPFIGSAWPSISQHKFRGDEKTFGNGRRTRGGKAYEHGCPIDWLSSHGSTRTPEFLDDRAETERHRKTLERHSSSAK
jgi:hypothetical protein